MNHTNTACTMCIRTGSDGYVQASEQPGLGYAIDWDAMHAATIHRLGQSRPGLAESGECLSCPKVHG